MKPKSQTQYTKILFPLNKIIIQITSKLTRAPLLGKWNKYEIEKVHMHMTGWSVAKPIVLTKTAWILCRHPWNQCYCKAKTRTIYVIILKHLQCLWRIILLLYYCYLSSFGLYIYMEFLLHLSKISLNHIPSWSNCLCPLSISLDNLEKYVFLLQNVIREINYFFSKEKLMCKI